MHVPRDDDEWLLFETERLTQFTRLFPPLPRTTTATASASATAVAGAVVEAEADAEEAGAEEDESGAKSLQSRSSGKFKPASFNEIICQVIQINAVNFFFVFFNIQCCTFNNSSLVGVFARSVPSNALA